MAHLTLASTIDVGLLMSVVAAAIALVGLLYKLSQGVAYMGRVLERIEAHDAKLGDHAARIDKIDTKLEQLDQNTNTLRVRLASCHADDGA